LTTRTLHRPKPDRADVARMFDFSASLAVAGERHSSEYDALPFFDSSGGYDALAYSLPTRGQDNWGKLLPAPSQGPIPQGRDWYDRR
jgi:hypothetical protein